MTFKDRYAKILSDNRLGVQDFVERTGMTRHAFYRMMSEDVVDKYENIEKLFSICETPEQIIELATGNNPPESSHVKTESQMLSVVEQLLEEVRELRQEIRKLREGKERQKVRFRQKVPDDH